MSEDMHEHRRSGDDPESMSGRRMQAVADSTFAKSIARLVMPVMLGIIGYYLVQSNTRIENTQQVQGADIVQVKSDVRDVNTRLTEGVLRQVDSNSKHIDNLEQRVQVLERVVHTP